MKYRKLLLLTFGVLSLSTVFYACGSISTAPSGNGAVDESGAYRDPSEMLAVGTKAPSVSAPDQNGNTVQLDDFRGKKNVVLIFYPGNETPGCTRQLCSARDAWEGYKQAEVEVFGVNPASAESHQKFASNHSFPFPLIADTEGYYVRSFGARGALGVTIRTVYGINKEGVIVFAERGMPSTEAILAAFQ